MININSILFVFWGITIVLRCYSQNYRFFTMTFYFMYAIDFVNLAEVEIYVDTS